MRDKDMKENSEMTKFMLIAHQRSGSNALHSVLQQHPEIFFYGQLFGTATNHLKKSLKWGMPFTPVHQDHLYMGGRTPKTSTVFRHQLLRFLPKSATPAKHVERFFDKAKKRTTDKHSCVGFKLHDSQMSYLDLRLVAQNHVDKVVILRRRNVLQAAVSCLYAQQTDVWATRKKTRGAKTVALAVARVEEFAKETLCSTERVRATLELADVQYHEMEYENTVLLNQYELLWRYLGVEEVEMEPLTKRLSTPDYSHISNAAEINEALAGEKFGWLY